MDRGEALVEVRRGGTVESRHRVSCAVVDERGHLVAWTGDPSLVAYIRSSAKPFQAIPLVADGAADAFELSEEEIAICCGSHAGEPAHVTIVQGILDRIGLTEDDLECGPHKPFHRPSAERLRESGVRPTRIHNNCSGKHAGMLAWTVHQNAPTGGYRKANHPVQQRIRREIIEWTGVSELPTAIDGCGVVTFALPLHAMAGAYARLAESATAEPRGAPGRIVTAMTGQPYFVAGTGRLATDTMRLTEGRILMKGGAEGVLCAADRESGVGVALKVEDGATRAVAGAILECLAQLEMISDEEQHALAEHRVGSLTNTLEEVVGEVRATVRLERGDS